MVKNLAISIFLLTFAIGIVGSHDPMTRELSTSPFPINKVDVIKKVDYMTRKKPLKQVLQEFKSVHGDRYIYTEINEANYYGNKIPVPVICREHGIFKISVWNHLQGQGCPVCANIRRKLSNTGNFRKRTGLVYGVGINDYGGNVKCNNVHIKSYHTWVAMLARCYSKDFLRKNHTYCECAVCDEWLHFSKFKEWYDKNSIDGCSLDKDILVKKNKVYSPDTCCFVPNEINSLLCKSDKKRGNMPIGVCERKMVHGLKYVAYLNNSTKKHFHLGTFSTPEEAFIAYKNAKESYIKEIAAKYYKDGKITDKVYSALMNYKVEITD